MPKLSTHAEGSARHALLRHLEERPAVWLAVIAGLLAIQISPWFYPAPDALPYLSTARSIAYNHRLAALGNAQLGYPPGYPVLISPAFWFDAPPFLGLACIHWLLAIVAMLGVYRWARRACPQAALLVTALVMVNVSFWIVYRRPLSELAFMTVLVWAVQLLDAALACPSATRALAMSAAGGRLLAGLSMIREVGIVVAAGFAWAAAMSVWSERWRWTTAALCTLLVAAPPSTAVLAFVHHEAAMRAASPAPAGTHVDGLTHVTQSLAPQLLEGVRLRISEVGRLLIPGMFKSYARAGDWVDINIALYVPLFVLVAAGWSVVARRRSDVLVLTLPFYFFAYVVWSFDSATRYLTPFLPVLVVSLWYALAPLAHFRQTLFAGLLIAHLGVALGFWMFVEMPRARACTAHWDDLAALSGNITADARGAGSASIALCERLLLELILDRHVGATESPLAGRSAAWIVSNDGTAMPSGYTLAAQRSAYQLWVTSAGRAAGAPSDAR